MMHRRLLALALATLLLAPSASYAASATQTGYDDNDAVQVQDDTDDGGNSPATTTTAAASPTTASSSSLPFTGLEAGLIAAAGLGLAGTGFALRKATREQ